ncbi:pyruvate kinase [Aminicella lysinilytica]|uniref:Pyruvate kinase n=1 Tax=Aminicella lysinilytica TaxID=433323 RepID=A0A4R6QB18_9FIRM|nr:pyruvate kinase [Aminicella lysinilytica]TDP59864.1 pyruvate kinase [Aminicella lysinilytica]
MRKTKIICTIGPASRDEATMEKLLKAGMNVARLNFSHGSHQEHRENIERFRRVRDSLGLPAAVLLDTKGPEIRIRSFQGGKVLLKDGEYFTITTRDVEGTEKIVSVTYEAMPREVSKGKKVLINDGKVMLEVIDTTDTDVNCKVIHGGVLSDNKGVNLPNVNLGMEFMSEKDKSDLLFGIENDVDYVAASFVRTGDDVRNMREFLCDNGGEQIRIIAKIESTQGVENFEEILSLADGIMIARGDMGVELAFEKLPGIQKKFIRRCVQSGKTVITATQMLESMISSPVPTRAETNDVANAVFDGTSAVMLSGETAAGQYPVEAVTAMAKIAEQAEDDKPRIANKDTVWHEMDSDDLTNAVGHAACTLARDIDAAAIMAVTKSGYTARRMAKFRPDITIIGATPYLKVYHQLALTWGVRPLRAEQRGEVEELFSHCISKAIRAGVLNDEDRVVLSAGLPLNVSGNTNIIRVETASLTTTSAPAGPRV